MFSLANPLRPLWSAGRALLSPSLPPPVMAVHNRVVAPSSALDVASSGVVSPSAAPASFSRASADGNVFGGGRGRPLLPLPTLSCARHCCGFSPRLTPPPSASLPPPPASSPSGSRSSILALHRFAPSDRWLFAPLLDVGAGERASTAPVYCCCSSPPPSVLVFWALLPLPLTFVAFVFGSSGWPLLACCCSTVALAPWAAHCFSFGSPTFHAFKVGYGELVLGL
jgi:hypothetical protein